MLLVKEPQTDKQFEALFLLRWQELRKPWGKPLGSERDDQEQPAIHAAIFKDDVCIACGRLQLNNANEAQIRYMAVSTNTQGQGLGSMILTYLEEKAREKKVKKVILQSRENAVRFYVKNGYWLKEKSYVLFDSIQHYLMEKELD